jgi:hypothetical protein
MYRWMRLSILTLVLVAAATPSFAALGLQAGASIDPDMFLIAGVLRVIP